MIAQIEFTEWTPDGHLRRSKFVGLKEDKEAGDVVRERGKLNTSITDSEIDDYYGKQ
jgi:ATP-dependent DNA ligase